MKLNDAQKLFIVKALACYDSPTQVANAFREEFGLTVERTQVAKYDPTKAGGGGGAEMSAKLRTIFKETRKTFEDKVGELPIAKQSFRLRILERCVRKAESQGNMALVASLLEQAAKEVGGVLTNRREMTGADGTPICTPLSLADFYGGTRPEPQPGSS